jgi:ABC-2 type transport system permease protein
MSGFWSATRLVAQREINAQVRGKGFWISFAVFVAGLFAAAILPGLFDDGDRTTVAVVGPDAERLVATTDLEPRPAATVDEARTLVRDGEVRAAVVPDPAVAGGVRVLALTQRPYRILAALAQPPPVDLLTPDAVDDGVTYIVAFAFAFVFFVFGMAGVGIAQSVVVEKQTRIVEILVATIPVRALLTGKIVAYSLLVFGQVGTLALLTPIALRLGDQGMVLSLIAPALGWFVPFFILGFILLASLWAAAGALVSRLEDLGSSSTLVSMLVLVPYLAVSFLQGNDTALTVLSYVPFSAAVAMPVRMFAGDPAPWEPFASMALLAVTVTVFVLVGSRLYTGSLLQTGARVRLRRAWSEVEHRAGR